MHNVGVKLGRWRNRGVIIIFITYCEKLIIFTEEGSPHPLAQNFTKMIIFFNPYQLVGGLTLMDAILRQKITFIGRQPLIENELL